MIDDLVLQYQNEIAILRKRREDLTQQRKKIKDSHQSLQDITTRISLINDSIANASYALNKMLRTFGEEKW